MYWWSAAVQYAFFVFILILFFDVSFQVCTDAVQQYSMTFCMSFALSYVGFQLCTVAVQQHSMTFSTVCFFVFFLTLF